MKILNWLVLIAVIFIGLQFLPQSKITVVIVWIAIFGCGFGALYESFRLESDKKTDSE